MKAKLILVSVPLILALGSCGMSNVHSVEGSVGRIGEQGGRRFIQLEDNKTVYECWVSEVRDCAVLELGDEVVMQVGMDHESGIDDFVDDIQVN